MPFQTGVIEEGRNCWKKTSARGGQFLIDGLSYYCDLFDSLQKAQKQIFILGWDLADDITLDPSFDELESSRTLGAVLLKLVSLKPELTIHILVWDSYPFFQGDRIPMEQLQQRFKHPQIHLQPHRQLPYFASFHQKLVVIDDDVAYCGGIDLTANRKDSIDHQQREVVHEPHGRFHPMHDLQMRVQGEVARELGDLARSEWTQVTGQKLSPCPEVAPLAILQNDFTNASVAISRTQPGFADISEIREIELLSIDLISSAKKLIYIEAQYLSSEKVTRALCKKLQEPEGPEIVLVTQKNYLGWWEEKTLGSLRQLRIKELKEADRHQRCGIYYPHNQGPIGVHSKLIVIDDSYAMIGSPNLTRRSGGLDFECSLTIDATELPDKNMASIRELTCRLLSEHLDLKPRHISEWLKSGQPINQLIHECNNSQRCLTPLPSRKLSWTERWLTHRKWSDPDEGMKFKASALKKFIPLLILGLMVWLLSSRIESINWGEVYSSIQGYSSLTLISSFALAMLGYAFYCSYDLLAKTFFKHDVSRLKTAAIGFVSYAFTLNIGSIIGGAGLRYRLYGKAGLTATKAGQIYGLSVVTNWLGFATLLGLVLTFTNPELPGEWTMSNTVINSAGPLALLLVCGYLAATHFLRHKRYKWRDFNFTLPSTKIALLQIGLSLASWTSMALVFAMILGTEIALYQILFAMLLASLAGVVLRVPAGLGVQEAAILVVLGSQMADHRLLAAFITFRAFYYFIPLLLGLGLFIYLELNSRSS